MLKIYEKYGYFCESLKSVTFKGADGAIKMSAMMEELRNNPPEKIGGLKVLACRDYKSGERVELSTGKVSPTFLPESNVLYYELENYGWCCVRPSGTEPKIKFYFGAKGNNIKEAEKIIEAIEESLIKLVSI